MNYKEIIRLKGYRYNYIAERLGISNAFLSMCLSGKKRLSDKHKEHLHRLLELK